MSFDLLSYPVSYQRSSPFEGTLVASKHGLHSIYAFIVPRHYFTSPSNGLRTKMCHGSKGNPCKTGFLGKRPIRNVKSYHFVEQHLLISTLMW